MSKEKQLMHKGKTIEQMKLQAYDKIKDMNFDELKEVFIELNKKVVNVEINEIILDRMEEVDEARFIDWMLED